MVVQNNFQKATFLNYSSSMTGSVFTTFNNISEYFALGKANEQLVAENARLKESLSSAFLVTDTCMHYTRDTLFQYTSAKVINSTISKRKNFLVLNKGTEQGIKKDMGVICPSGLVGTVVDVSEHFSRVMPAINTSNKINARIKKNRHLGNIEWDGKDYQYSMLTDIPSHVRLSKGDTIISSGNSFIFPEGILIGTVDEYYSQEGEKFGRARIRFSVDYNNLYYVYVITNLMLEEQLNLESEESGND